MAVTVEESQKQPWEEPAAQVTEDDSDKPSTQEELEAMAADMVGIDDPVRMYLKEIGKVPLLNAEEEVVFAKAIELGEQIVEEPWRTTLSLWEWTKNQTEKASRDKRTEHRLDRYAADADRIVREAFEMAEADGLLQASPDLHLTGAQRSARKRERQGGPEGRQEGARGLPRGAYARWASRVSSTSPTCPSTTATRNAATTRAFGPCTTGRRSSRWRR